MSDEEQLEQDWEFEWDATPEVDGFTRLVLAERVLKTCLEWDRNTARFAERLAKEMDDYLHPDPNRFPDWSDCYPDPWTPEEVLDEAQLRELRVNNDRLRLIELLERAGLEVHPQLRERYSAF